MFIKLKIEGDLLKALEIDAEESVRTCTQQAMYIIKSYYKEGMNKKNYARIETIEENKSSNSSNDETKGSESIEKEPEEPIVTYDEPEGNISDSELIDEEIYNF